MERKGCLNVDRATVDFLQTATGTNFEIDEDVEVIDMCKAWKNSMAQAKSTGRAEGEDRLSRLIARLLDIGKTDEILSATKDAALRNQLYGKYSIV